MSTLLTHSITGILGLVIGLFLCSKLGCGEPLVDPSIQIGTASPTEKRLHHQAETEVRDSIVYRDRWRVINAPAEIRYVTIRDTVLWRPDVAQFVARLDTITPLADTLGISYLHPAGLFEVDYRPRPDTLSVVTVTEKEIIAIETEKKWGLGFHAGPSVQMGVDGVVRGGVSMGVGVNFNLWEP